MNSLTRKIINAIYDEMLSYFQSSVEVANGVLYAKGWKFDEIGCVLYNKLRDEDGEEYEVTVGLSKDYKGYFVQIEGLQVEWIESCCWDVPSLGRIVDGFYKDINRIVSRTVKCLNGWVENGFY